VKSYLLGRPTAVRRPLLAGIVALIASLSLAACSSSASSASGGSKPAGTALATVRIAVAITESSMAVEIAQKQGFFQQNGINAEITKVTDISKVPPALGSQFDIGFGTVPQLLSAAHNGLPVVMASALELTTPSNPLEVLVARPGADIHGAADFKGKTVGAPTLSGNTHLALRAWLQQEAGLDISAVHAVVVPPANMLDELKSGAIDVGEMSQPYAYEAIQDGMVDVGNPIPAVVGNPAAMSIWATDKSYASSNMKQILEFRAACNEAIQWMKNNPAATAEDIASFTGIPLAVAKAAPRSTFVTQPETEYLSQWGVLMQKFGIPGDFDYSSLIAK
jgi:NitT/TauT family transport system substrate-binding protein